MDVTASAAALYLSGFATVVALATLALVVAIWRRTRPGADHEAQEARERMERTLRDGLAEARREAADDARALREEVSGGQARFANDVAQRHDALARTLDDALNRFGDRQGKQMDRLFEIQAQQHEAFGKRLDALAETLRTQGETLRTTVETQLTTLRTENGQKLDQMRQTVDEKLQGTLEKRLGESFKAVSERLEAVHKGLGEMQNLASGVGDLKRVLTNVKTRGSWGEVALGGLLEQVLTPDQYLANAQVRENSGERVEFAIRLPGRDDDETEVLLPIDAKFPVEDWERLTQASDAGDAEAVAAAGKALEARIRQSAGDISEKYINPPRTTDFAIMFLPTEGLYAEVIRRPGLCDDLQRNNRVVVAGPTTFAALLNSLQMGFRTLAIQKRSSEVWQVLAAVKTEFGKFGDTLGRLKNQLTTASNTIEKVEQRNRVMQRRLRSVEALPEDEAGRLLELDDLRPGDAAE